MNNNTGSSSSSSSSSSTSSSAGLSAGPMMYLKNENAIVAEYLRKRLDPDAPEATDMDDIRITDYDEAKLRIEVPEDALNLIKVSLKLNNFSDLKTIGIDDYLRSVYGPLYSAPYDDADVTLVVDRQNLPSANINDVINKVANIRKYCISYPILRMLNLVGSGKGGGEKPFIFRTVPEEPVFILSRTDRVSVIFHLRFEEPTDRAIARIVVQELTEANRVVNNAPVCSWSEREPPLELKGIPNIPLPNQDPNSIGYLTFSIFPNSCKTDNQKEIIAGQFSLFRNYLLYHIKAAKAYLHARMRNRCDSLQRVLNRAIPEDPFADKEKKLASGKTFVRK